MLRKLLLSVFLFSCGSAVIASDDGVDVTEDIHLFSAILDTLSGERDDVEIGRQVVTSCSDLTSKYSRSFSPLDECWIHLRVLINQVSVRGKKSPVTTDEVCFIKRVAGGARQKWVLYLANLSALHKAGVFTFDDNVRLKGSLNLLVRALLGTYNRIISVLYPDPAIFQVDVEGFMKVSKVSP